MCVVLYIHITCSLVPSFSACNIENLGGGAWVYTRLHRIIDLHSRMNGGRQANFWLWCVGQQGMCLYIIPLSTSKRAVLASWRMSFVRASDILSRLQSFFHRGLNMLEGKHLSKARSPQCWRPLPTSNSQCIKPGKTKMSTIVAKVSLCCKSKHLEMMC